MSGASERGIILAAGNGRRLGYTAGPKALVSIHGRTILERQVTALARAGVREVLVVVGYMRELVQEHCAALETRIGVEITQVVNPHWAKTNTVYSMHLAIGLLEGRDAFTLNGDVLFPTGVLAGLRAAGRAIALAVDEKPCGQEEVKVKLGPDDSLQAIHKGMASAEAAGEFIGIARFTAAAASSFHRALEDELREHGPMSYYDYALSRLPVETQAHGVRFRDVPMIEIDFPEDLERAQLDVALRIRALEEA
jgi:choline kinase